MKKKFESFEVLQKQEISFQPGSQLSGHSSGIHAYLPRFSKIVSDINFNFQLELRGMEELSFVPDGYIAQWKVTSFASNIEEKVRLCEHHNCERLFANSFGVNHIQGVDVYLQSERSVKYGFLFIGLTFITFFIFETIKKLPIHAIQDTLVGSAIAIFYLLLVSLSEHLEFALSYLIASICSIYALISASAQHHIWFQIHLNNGITNIDIAINNKDCYN